jgi:hypothetical protein
VKKIEKAKNAQTVTLPIVLDSLRPVTMIVVSGVQGSIVTGEGLQLEDALLFMISRFGVGEI